MNERRRDALIGYATWAVLFAGFWVAIGLARRVDGAVRERVNCAQMTRRGGRA